jgi:tryptophan synthase beta chain
MQSYDDYFSNRLVKHEVTTQEIEASLATLSTPEI